MASALKVAFVTLVDLAGTSGQNAFSRELAAALARQPGVDLSLVCPKQDADVTRLVGSTAVRVEYLPAKVLRSVRWQLKVQSFLVRAIRRLHRATGGLDLIVATSRPGLLLLPLVCSRLGIEEVLFTEGSLEGQAWTASRIPGARAVGRLSLYLNARASRRIFSLSEGTREEVAKMKGIGGSKVEFVHHGVRADRFPLKSRDAARASVPVPFPNGSWTVGFVGSFKWYHCVEALLRAVALLDDSSIRLMLVGEGPELARSRDLAGWLGLGERVTFTGHVDHDTIGAYMSACDVLFGVIHPDRRDNPMKVYEYLASGRPVLAFRTRELEFVRSIGGGQLLADVSPRSIADALGELRGRGETELSRMGERGRAHVLSELTWDALAARALACASARKVQ
jgi:glycosyltransferase involved in cell wall biosynthesis